MARSYTTYTATATLPIFCTFRCSCCGMQVQKTGKITAAQSSGQIRTKYAGSYNTNALQDRASEALQGTLQNINNKIDGLHAAIAESDIDARVKAVNKNKLAKALVSFDDKCTFCKARQGWSGAGLTAGWIALVVFLAFCGIGRIISTFGKIFTEGASIIDIIATAVIGLVCSFFAIFTFVKRKKTGLESIGRIDHECLPTIQIVPKIKF